MAPLKRTLVINAMAHLLGSKTCIDSLRVDIDDLQNVIHEIVGKTGSVKCHSWKFPDKIATDLDINELLQRYQHGKNETDNQVAHVVLFELIIDRLLLVLHGSWRYIHEMQINLLPNTADPSMTSNQPTSLSVGLVVKKYWNKILHFSNLLQQNENDRKRSNGHGTRTAPVQRPKSSLTQEKFNNNQEICSSCSKVRQNLQDQMESLIQLCHTYNLPSSLAQYRSSKTDRFSLEEINHWSDCQSKDIDRLSKHLEYLNNALNKTKSDLELNENRSKRQEENNRRLQQLINDDKQAKKALQDAHEQKLRQIKIDAEQQEKQIQQLNQQKLSLEEQLKQVNQLCKTHEEQIERLESSKDQLKHLTEERIKSETTIKTLEQDRIRLETELDLVKRDLEERNRELQKERTRIENMIRQEQNFQSKQKTLADSCEALAQECDALRKQLNEVELTRDDLERELIEVQENYQTSSVGQEQIQNLQSNNEQLVKEIHALKTNIEQMHRQIQQMEEREQLLVQYPDLNGPIEHQSTTQNLIADMQNQIRTNEIRIDLLRKQNQSLKSSLDKLMLVQQTTFSSNVTEERYEELRNQSRIDSFRNETTSSKSKSTPLWSLSNEILDQQAFTETRPMATSNYIPRFSENDYVANKWIQPESDVISLSPSNTEMKPVDRSSSRNSIRPPASDLIITAESRPATVIQSSRSTMNGRHSALPPPSDNEMIIGKGRTSNRPTSASKSRHHSANESSRRDNALVKTSRSTTSAKLPPSTTNNALHQCTNCQKTYDDKRNYDIHKLYCRNKE